MNQTDSKVPKRKCFFVNSLLTMLTVTGECAAVMAVCLGLLYFHYRNEIGLFAFWTIGGILVLYWLLSCKFVSIDAAGVKLYSLTKRLFFPWQEIACFGFFFHFVYIDHKKKYFYFSRKPVHFKQNPLAINALPELSENLIYLMDQKGLEETISMYTPNNKN